MTRANKFRIFAVVFFAACVAVTLVPQPVFAHDDFGDIVRHIEKTYHVHHSYGFLMGFAGFVTRVGHPAGVKNMRCAIFEDQHLDTDAPDNRLEEIVRHAEKSGWNPMVRSYSHRRGEQTFIYSKMDGEDLKLLLVTVEPSEAVVMQLKLNPDRLAKFIDDHTDHNRPQQDNNDLEAAR